MLAQLGANARQQHRKPEWLGDVIIGTGFEPENGVGIGVVAGQHDDRGLEAVLAQDANGFAPIHVRESHVHDHEIDMPGLGCLYALAAVLDGDRFEFLVERKLLDQCFAQLLVIVHNQDLAGIGHCSALKRAQ